RPGLTVDHGPRPEPLLVALALSRSRSRGWGGPGGPRTPSESAAGGGRVLHAARPVPRRIRGPHGIRGDRAGARPLLPPPRRVASPRALAPVCLVGRSRPGGRRPEPRVPDAADHFGHGLRP